MEDFGHAWTFHESVEELKHKLEYVTYELEMTRKITNEEIMKNNENIKKLVQLLRITCMERDEAKSKLKKLQQILAFNNNNKPLNVDQIIIPTTPFSPDTPLSTSHPSLAKSNSSSFEIEDCGTPSSNSIYFGGAATRGMMTCAPLETKVAEEPTLIIEGLAKGRPRPHQGKLLQAVLEAGPLLQTLMVAGSLPQWRNPPGMLSQQVPLVQPKKCNSNMVGLVSQNNKKLVNGSGDIRFYGQVTGGSMGVSPNPMLDFGNGSFGGSCLVDRNMMSSNVSFDCPTPKRQRLL
ncbi:uncharacterized protein LOC141638017 [Silene latifolia]|uniref:uncharacterized protein LOC141638017 n=1 Tax=Silene latifolia TaxID=37657 RepID=UPI003D78B0DC